MLLIRNIECKKIKTPIKRELFLAFLSLVLCSPIFSTENCLYYIILIIAGMGIDGALIRHGHKTEINRIVSTIVVTGLFLSIINLSWFDKRLSRMTENLMAYITQPGSVLDWLTIGRVKKLLIICIGLVLVSVESNYAIVFVLKRYKAFPGVNEAGGTDQENNGCVFR
jgi:hypothetical protein